MCQLRDDKSKQRTIEHVLAMKNQFLQTVIFLIHLILKKKHYKEKARKKIYTVEPRSKSRQTKN